MLWRDNRKSSNVEDRRGLSPSGLDGSGGGESGGMLRLLPNQHTAHMARKGN